MPNPPPPVRLSASSALQVAAPAARGTSTIRYPNLVTYLRWCRLVTQIAFGLLLAGGAWNLLQAIQITFINEGPGSGFPHFLAGALMAGCSCVTYVVNMAGVELVHVLIDIEANTRP